MCGITSWNYFSESLSKTSNTFTSNANIFGKVYFPRLIVPISIIISNIVKFIIQGFIFLLVLFYFYQKGANISPNITIATLDIKNSFIFIIN